MARLLLQGVARRTRTPIVVVLIHGAPLDVGWLHSSPRVGAILSAWTLGQARVPCQPILSAKRCPSARCDSTSRRACTDLLPPRRLRAGRSRHC